MKKNLSSNRYAVFLPIFYPTGCYSSVFTLIFPIVFVRHVHGKVPGVLFLYTPEEL